MTKVTKVTKVTSRMTTGGIEQLLKPSQAERVGFCHIWLSPRDRRGAVPVEREGIKRYNSICSGSYYYTDWVDGSDVIATVEGKEVMRFNEKSNKPYSYLHHFTERLNCALLEMNLYLCNVRISENRIDVYGDAYNSVFPSGP